MALLGKRAVVANALKQVLTQDYQPTITENVLVLGYRLAKCDCSVPPKFAQQQEWLPVGAILTGAKLQSMDLSGVYLPAADLRHAQLEGSILEGAELSGACLTMPHW